MFPAQAGVILPEQLSLDFLKSVPCASGGDPKGFIGGGAWNDYEENKNIIGNLRRLNELCGQNKTLLHELERKVTAPAVTVTKRIENYGKERQLSDDEIRWEFADAGKQRPENDDDKCRAAESVMGISGRK